MVDSRRLNIQDSLGEKKNLKGNFSSSDIEDASEDISSSGAKEDLQKLAKQGKQWIEQKD